MPLLSSTVVGGESSDICPEEVPEVVYSIKDTIVHQELVQFLHCHVQYLHKPQMLHMHAEYHHWRQPCEYPLTSGIN